MPRAPLSQFVLESRMRVSSSRVCAHLDEEQLLALRR